MKGKIMIVDDEPHNVRLAKRILEREGYEVREAYNTQEAIDALSGFEVDIILLDIMMPGRPPMDVIDWLRQQGKKTKVFYFSALKSQNEATRRVTRNLISDTDKDFVVGYIEKPFDNNDLLKRVSDAFGGKEDA